METDSEADDQTNGKAGGKVRSGTPYPFFGLPTAVRIVDAIRNTGGDEAANADVLKTLGVGKTDRLWAYGVPAAMQFGLVERVGRGENGRVRITPLAKRIALPASPDEKRFAKADAFKNPELYQKLLERFAGHPVPQKDHLRNLLCREYQIVESMAIGAAEAFLESLKDADLISANETVLASGNGVPPPTAGQDHQKKTKIDAVDPASQTISVPADFVIYKCKISKSRILEIPLPPEFSLAEVERLHAFLLTQVDDPPAAKVKTEPEPAS